MLRRPLSFGCLMVILFVYLGIRLAGSSPGLFSEQEGELITVTGRVYQKEYNQSTEQKMIYLHLTDTGQEEQNLICYLKKGQELPKAGAVVQVTGRLKCFTKASNPGQFDAESYYHVLKISYQLNQTEIQAKSDTYSRIGEGLYTVKNIFAGRLDASLQKADASIMKTMLLAQGSTDEEMKTLYQQNGIAHILAISGLHISLLGMGIYRLLKKTGIPVLLRTGIPAGVILLYGMMTGFSVSARRAVLMFILQMAAVLLGRTYDRITAAFAAAVLILVRQPYYLFHSGFLFTFGCIFAVGILLPALTEEVKKKEKQPGPFTKKVLASAAISAAGIPLQLMFFYQLPVYAFVLNLLVLPLMGLLVPAGFVLILLYGIPWIRTGAALLITGILKLYELACSGAGLLPGHLVTAGRPETVCLILYLLLLALTVIFQKKLRLKYRWLLVICGILTLLFVRKKEMVLTFLDVGQGDCIYLKTMEGNHYLIDGGSTSLSQTGRYRILPYLKQAGAGEVQAVFVTHPDQDHCSGILELLGEAQKQGITIRKLYLPDIGDSAKSDSYLALVSSAEEEDIPVDYISKGMAVVEEDFTLLCLHPEKDYESSESNAYSTVLYLQYKNFSALLTGDVENEGERKLIAGLEQLQESGNLQTITVLKAAHHGSAGTNSEALLSLTMPVYTVISCGKNNSYGHPHAELLERLKACGSRTLITWESGAVTFYTDGEKIRVEEFLKNH